MPSTTELTEQDLEADLHEEEYNKIIGQYRLQLNDLLSPLRMYGQGHYCDMLADQLVILSAQLHFKLMGIDIPYEVDIPRW